MAKGLPPVTTVEDAKAVFVTRAHWVKGYHGYGSDINGCLRALGLGAYFGAELDTYHISLTRLHEMLGDTTTVRLPLNRNPQQRTGEIIDTVYPILGKWVAALEESEWTKDDAPSKIVDIDAVGKMYGTHGTLPPAGNEEVTQCWRELVDGVLQWADQQGHCNSVEAFLRDIGFGEFLPPQYVTAVVEFGGHTITLGRVEADRQGQPRPEYLESHLISAMRQMPHTVKEVTPLPNDSN